MRKVESLYVGLVQQKTLQVLQGSAINEIPNIPQSALPPCLIYQTLLFDSGSETMQLSYGFYMRHLDRMT